MQAGLGGETALYAGTVHMLWSSAQLSVVEKAHVYSLALVMHQPFTH